MKLNRHKIREKALQTLFSLQFNKVAVVEALDFALYYEQEETVSNAETVLQLIEGVQSRREEINELIRPHLKRWTLDRLPKLNLLIMQIAIYEMLTGQAPGIAINEAVQLTKEYSDEKDTRFVNAVLNNVKTALEQ
ncbi:transcription antitermination factor NusB [Catellicoccus marimammalium]|uniref:transcription antitermination factor NusB n=1 Tax=Catellicoccus marimammalium TaxID=300419 RepID=UPI000590AA6A|nr:transcription antitermination factor NusB [Catellicoccus marimammalium]